MILSQVLTDEINSGYGNLVENSVHRVNGTQIKNLKHLFDLVNQSKKQSETIRFDLDDGK